MEKGATKYYLCVHSYSFADMLDDDSNEKYVFQGMIFRVEDPQDLPGNWGDYYTTNFRTLYLKEF